MRKIVSKQEADKKKRRNQFIVGGVLIAVMFLSVMGYAFQNNAISGTSGNSGNSSQTVNYNGINFVNQNGFWVLQSNNARWVFTYNPTEIAASNLTALTKTISDFRGKALYIYYNGSDSASSDAESEISFNMKNFASSINTQPVNESLNANCLENSIILESGVSGVKENGNCVYIYGQGEDLIKTTDNVLFKLLGVVQ